MQSAHIQGFAAPALVTLVQLPVLQPLFALLDVASALMTVQSEVATATPSHLLETISAVLRAPDWRLLLAGCTLHANVADATSLATFIAHCSQTQIAMTLAAILLKFMTARVEHIMSLTRHAGGQGQGDGASATLDGTASALARLPLADDAHSVDYDPALSEAAQAQLLRERAETAAASTAKSGASGGKKKRSKTKTFEEMTVEVSRSCH